MLDLPRFALLEYHSDPDHWTVNAVRQTFGQANTEAIRLTGKGCPLYIASLGFILGPEETSPPTALHEVVPSEIDKRMAIDMNLMLDARKESIRESLASQIEAKKSTGGRDHDFGYNEAIRDILKLIAEF